MKSILKWGVAIAVLTLFMAGCGDEVTTENVTQLTESGSATVESVDDLPQCDSALAGQFYLVSEKGAFYGCNGKEWTVLSGGSSSIDTLYISSNDYSCTTRPDSAKTGLVIVCNGDSIGFVKNGSKGDPGIPGDPGVPGDSGAVGAGCHIVTSSMDSAIIVCGSDSLTISLVTDAGVSDPVVESCDDDENCDIPLSAVVLSGFSQKGPFIKGASVVAYELLNGKSLKQTGKVFNGMISGDDGLFNISTVKLASQYVYLVATGTYRNEVTGQLSDTDISLRALTNLRNRSSANINLLTHLEYDRVVYLVTKRGMSVKAAKDSAKNEIFSLFHIDSKNFAGGSEDLNVFGEDDRNGALLAVSVMLQGRHNRAELSEVLTAISDDIKDDAKWDSVALRAMIADTVLSMEVLGEYDSIRKHVASWELGKVPNFEKYLRNYWRIEYGLGECGSADIPVGTITVASNKAVRYYASEYASTSDKGGLTRFICVDDENSKIGKHWRLATDLEKDTYKWTTDGVEPGAWRNGILNSDSTYVFEDGKWRYGSSLDSILEKACIKSKVGEYSSVKLSGAGYQQCVEDADGRMMWDSAPDIYNDLFDAKSDCNLSTEGNLMTGAASGHKYLCDFANSSENEFHGWVEASGVESVLGGCTQKNKDSVGVYDNEHYVCLSDDGVYSWRIASEARVQTYRFICDNRGELLAGLDSLSKRYVCDDTFRVATDVEVMLERGCVSYTDGTKLTSTFNKTEWTCRNKAFEYDDSKTYTYSEHVMLNGEADIPVAGIGLQVWMNQDVFWDFDTFPVSSTRNHHASRSVYDASYEEIPVELYTWAAAVDSALQEFCGHGEYCGYLDTLTGFTGICPSGWRLPSKSDWEQLFTFVGGSQEKLRAYGFDVADRGIACEPSESSSGTGLCTMMDDTKHYWTSTENEASSRDAYTANISPSQLEFRSVRKAGFNAIRCVKRFK